MAPRIAVVAGEASGDLLGAGLIEAIKRRAPQARFEGVTGPRMAASGCDSIASAERLAVMGLVEPIKRLPELLRLRRRLVRRFLATRPDVFVGIDAPDFNLGLEQKLHAAGIPCVHYVSPSVWAWRAWRVRKIARSVDLMLTLFPFEAEFYRAHRVKAVYTGHPLAEHIPEHTAQAEARKVLGLSEGARVLALLPGSREGEVERLGSDFLRACRILHRRHPELGFIAPMATARVKEIFENQRRTVASDLTLRLFDGMAQQVMAAADAVLLASGTATLEAMLIKRPMVVAYRLAPASHRMLKHLKLLRVDRYALPNLLAGRDLVPEFIQDAVRPETLAAALEPLLYDKMAGQQQTADFLEIHRRLRAGGSERAAEAVLQLIGVAHE